MALPLSEKGLGLVTPLGCGVETTWRRLVEGECGIRQLTPYDLKMGRLHNDVVSYTFEQLSSKVAGVVPCGSGDGHFDESLWLKSKVFRFQFNSVFFLLICTRLMSCAQVREYLAVFAVVFSLLV